MGVGDITQRAWDRSGIRTHVIHPKRGELTPFREGIPADLGLLEVGRLHALIAVMKSAVFFERDGVLNTCETRGQHQVVPLRLEQFRVNEEARELLSALKKAGFLLIVATNQPGVSQGLLSRNELDLMHTILRRKLPIDDVLICPYDDASHPCCKPQPGLFMEAAFKWSLDLDRSFVISDKWQDAKAAQIAGCTSVMIQSPWIGDDHHDFLVKDLGAAVRKILQLQGQVFAHAASA